MEILILTTTESLRMKGAEGVFAIGDCTATSYAPTAQVAQQEGSYLGRILNQLAKKDTIVGQLADAKALPDTDPEKKTKIETLESQRAKLEKLRPFRYSHQGSLAYIGSDKAIADLPFFSSGNLLLVVLRLYVVVLVLHLGLREVTFTDVCGVIVVPLLAQCVLEQAVLSS